MKMTYDIRYIVNDDCVIAFASPNRLDDQVEKLRRIVAFYFDVDGNDNKGLLIPKNTSRIPNPTFGPYSVTMDGIERWAYKGIARLKPGDTADVEVAKEIARKKALRQASSAYRQALLKLDEQIALIQFDLATSCNKLSKKMFDLTNEINPNA